MLENELIELVKEIQERKTESNYIEIKSANKGCPKLYDTFSSFSNQNGGGKIVFGIDENDNYSVCGVYDASELQKKIMEKSLQMEPNIRPVCSVAKIDDKTVVCAEIQEIDNFQKPCFYKGAGRLKGSYIRVADGDRQMNEYEVYSYEAFKKKIHDELRIADRATKDDIFTNDLDKYFITLNEKKPKLSMLSKEKVCELQGLLQDNLPTLAGTMLFSYYPQAYFPQLCVTAVVVPGVEMSQTGNVGERFIDNKRIDGTIPQMIDESIKFVRNNMYTKTIVNNNTGKREDRTEYPLIAIREIIINALVHRDYSIHTDFSPITIKKFDNRIEIENPGGLYGRMTLDQLGKISADTRNPYIANALEIMGETENRYSGIPTVINAMAENNLPAPKFENDRGVFRVTLYNQNSVINIEDDILDSILSFCKTPKSRAELAERFKDKITITYMMTKYIHPLIEQGVLKYTIPEKPRSKNQKYLKV